MSKIMSRIVVRFGKYILNLLFFNFLYSLYLFFVNDRQALYENPSCLKCILGISLSPAYKKFFTISFILYILLLYLENKTGPTKEILLKGVFIPKLLNIPLAFYSLINFDFLLSHTAHSDKTIIFPFYLLALFVFLLSVSFLNFKKYDKVVLQID